MPVDRAPGPHPGEPVSAADGRRIRVLEMIDRPFLGGGQVHLLSLARALDRNFFECAVCSAGGGPLEAAVAEAGLPHYAVALQKKLDFRIIRSVRDVLEEFRPDILHTHGGVAGLFGRLAARGPGRPRVVHTLHGIHYLHYGNPLLRWGMVQLERHLSRFSDAVICVSADDLGRARSLRLASTAQLILIRNGIDVDAISPFPGNKGGRPDPAENFREDGKGPVVGTIARLHRQKGLVFLIDAAGPLRERIPGVRILIVGGGPLRESLSARIRQKGLEGTVRLLGERADASRLLSGFDVFVLPSLWEGLPYALLEAGARRRPVVASDIEGNRELIRHGKSGWLVPPADPSGLAAGIGRLLLDPEEAARMGEALHEEVTRDFTLTGMVDRTAGLYRRLFSERPRFDAG